MILCKVLNNASNEVPNLLASKIALKHSGKSLEAMAEIAKAARVHSLEEFKNVVRIGTSLCSALLLMLSLGRKLSRLLEIRLSYCTSFRSVIRSNARDKSSEDYSSL
jgi:hypothetical protein